MFLKSSNCHLSSVNCPRPSTSVESSLQISYFLCKTNPILSAVGGLQMNVKIYNTRDYEKFITLAGQKNKANSNPIKANFQKAKMNVNLTLTKDYRKKDDFAVRKNKPNSNPISVKPKMNVNLYVIEDYENKTTFRLRKNKPNQSQFQMPSNPSKERKKKGFRNFFWVSVAGKDIIYGKSRFSLKFGESSFDCLSFRSLL